MKKFKTITGVLTIVLTLGSSSDDSTNEIINDDGSRRPDHRCSSIENHNLQFEHTVGNALGSR